MIKEMKAYLFAYPCLKRIYKVLVADLCKHQVLHVDLGSISQIDFARNDEASQARTFNV